MGVYNISVIDSIGEEHDFSDKNFSDPYHLPNWLVSFRDEVMDNMYEDKKYSYLPDFKIKIDFEELYQM